MMGRILLMFLLVLMISACRKDKMEIENLHDGKILAAGHGGCGFQSYTNPYPANSMISITRAIEGLGADGVEVDVQMSADRKLILYHNETLESGTGCTGCIPSKNSGELLACTYNRDFNVSQFSEEHLVLLETVLQRYSPATSHPVIYLDLREGNACDETDLPDPDTLAYEVANMITKYSAEGWVYVIANTSDMLRKVRRYNGNVRTYLDGFEPSMLSDAEAFHIDGFVVSNNEITAEQVRTIHEHNIEVVIFDVKTREGILSAIEKSPDAIQADNLELLLEVLR